jgi:hypothetical protein
VPGGSAFLGDLALHHPAVVLYSSARLKRLRASGDYWYPLQAKVRGHQRRGTRHRGWGVLQTPRSSYHPCDRRASARGRTTAFELAAGKRAARRRDRLELVARPLNDEGVEAEPAHHALGTGLEPQALAVPVAYRKVGGEAAPRRATRARTSTSSTPTKSTRTHPAVSRAPRGSTASTRSPTTCSSDAA